MPLYQIVVLGIVQGLTEFLPVSSTAHLYLTSRFFGWQTEGLDFDIMLHIGTLLAVLIYFAIGYRLPRRGSACGSGTTRRLSTIPCCCGGLLSAAFRWASPG